MKKFFIAIISALALVILPASSALAVNNYGGQVIQPVDCKTYTILLNTGASVTLDNVGCAGGKIKTTFKGEANGKFIIVSSSTLPSGAGSSPSGTVYNYYDVTLDTITNADFGSTTWTFSVTKAWLSQNGLSAANVFLYHYDGSAWQRLTTREVSSTDTTVTFEADIPSFSDFAIVGDPSLTNTGTPYMLGALLSIGILVVIGAAFIFSRKRSIK